MCSQTYTTLGADSVTFEDLTLAFTEWDCGGENRSLPCDMQSTSWQTSAAVELEDVSDVSFSRVACAHHGANAMWIRSGENVSFTDGSMSGKHV